MSQVDRIERARELRQLRTDAERKLWSIVRNRQLDGFKFRRQYPIDRYFADFACVEAKLVVELDGGQHSEQAEYDVERTTVIERGGFVVLRLWNHHVLYETDGAIRAILLALYSARA